MSTQQRAAGNRTAEDREKAAEKAIKVLGTEELIIKGKEFYRHRAVKGEIVSELYLLDTACAGHKRTHQRDSKRAKRAIKTFSAAVHRANMPHGGIPEDYRILLGLDRLAHDLAVYERSLGNKPKPDAYEKRMAAEAGLRLCERFDVKPTTTKRGTFCRLAAVLYGDERADLQHHCREVLKRRKTKT